MKIATSTNIRPDNVTEPQLFAALARAGFDGIDLPFYKFVDDVDWSDDAAAFAWADQRNQWAKDAGLEWVQAHGPFFEMFNTDSDAQQSRQGCHHALKVCGRLGIPWMVLHPDVCPGDGGPEHRAHMFKTNTDFFRSLIETCEKYNVGVAIENIFDYYAQNKNSPHYIAAAPDEQCALIDQINHPLIGACWDTGHAHINNQNQYQGITTLGHRLKAIHIQETKSGPDRDDHVLPFSITSPAVDWNAVCSALKEIQFRGPFAFEVHQAIRRIPMELLDDLLTYNHKVGRYLINQITAS